MSGSERQPPGSSSPDTTFSRDLCETGRRPRFPRGYALPLTEEVTDSRGNVDIIKTYLRFVSCYDSFTAANDETKKRLLRRGLNSRGHYSRWRQAYYDDLTKIFGTLLFQLKTFKVLMNDEVRFEDFVKFAYAHSTGEILNEPERVELI